MGVKSRGSHYCDADVRIAVFVKLRCRLSVSAGIHGSSLWRLYLPQIPKGQTKVLVFDLGGGTFDASLLVVSEKLLEACLLIPRAG